MKKRLITTAVLLAAVLAVSLIIYVKVTQDPNYQIKNKAVSISQDKTVKVSYELGHLFVLADKKIPVFEFIPAESAEYVIEVTDIHSDSGDVLSVNVVDRSFTDYVAANNVSEEDGTITDSISDKAFLSKGRRYYILTDAFNNGSSSVYSGSFDLTVKRSEDEDGPEEIAEDQTVRLTVNRREHSSVSFTPEVTGYYRFLTEIVSDNASTGFSEVSGVSTAGSSDADIPVSDGICYLEAGNEYYVQIGVEEISGKSAKVDVRCRAIGTGEFDEEGTAVIEAPSVIEYTAEESGSIMVFSESEGDPEITIYDRKWFPLRSDDDSGEEFGGGSKDFAVVFNAKEGEKYLLYVSGKFSECRIKAVKYEEEVEPEEGEEEPAEQSEDSEDTSQEEQQE